MPQRIHAKVGRGSFGHPCICPDLFVYLPSHVVYGSNHTLIKKSYAPLNKLTFPIWESSTVTCLLLTCGGRPFTDNCSCGISRLQAKDSCPRTRAAFAVSIYPAVKRQQTTPLQPGVNLGSRRLLRAQERLKAVDGLQRHVGSGIRYRV